MRRTRTRRDRDETSEQDAGPGRTGAPARNEVPLHDVAGGAGNEAVDRLLAAAQTKLDVGPAHDPAEVNADAVARRVADTLACDGPGEVTVTDDGPTVRRTPRAVGAEGGAVDAGTEELLAQVCGEGRSLPTPLRLRMEGAFETDFSDVRIHDGPRSEDLNDRLGAKAFTVGSDIFFRGPAPATSSRADTELVAHELTHVVQQGSAGSAPTTIRRLATTAGSLGETGTVGKAKALVGQSNYVKIKKELAKYHSASAPAKAKHLNRMLGLIAAWMKENSSGLSPGNVARKQKLETLRSEIKQELAGPAKAPGRPGVPSPNKAAPVPPPRPKISATAAADNWGGFSPRDFGLGAGPAPAADSGVGFSPRDFGLGPGPAPAADSGVGFSPRDFGLGPRPAADSGVGFSPRDFDLGPRPAADSGGRFSPRDVDLAETPPVAAPAPPDPAPAVAPMSDLVDPLIGQLNHLAQRIGGAREAAKKVALWRELEPVLNQLAPLLTDPLLAPIREAVSDWDQLLKRSLPVLEEQAEYMQDLSQKDEKFAYLTTDGIKAVTHVVEQVIAQQAGGELPLMHEFDITDAEAAAIRIYTCANYRYMNAGLAQDRGEWLESSIRSDKGARSSDNRILGEALAPGSFGPLSPADTAAAEGNRHSRTALEGLKKLPPAPCETYRGMGLTEKEFKTMFKDTTTWHSKSFTSTSQLQNKAFDFASQESINGKVGVFLIFDQKFGRDIEKFSSYGHEKEILLLPGATGTITKIETKLFKNYCTIPISERRVEYVYITQTK